MKSIMLVVFFMPFFFLCQPLLGQIKSVNATKKLPESPASKVSPNELPVFEIKFDDKSIVPGEGMVFYRNGQKYEINLKDKVTLTAEDGIEITGDYPYFKVGLKKHKVGDKYLDGTVFYVDETGQHGLIYCTYNGPATWSTFQWEYPNGDIDNDEFKDLNTYATGIGMGQYNTMSMMLADNIGLNVVDPGEPYSIPYYIKLNKNDWYVPSIDELKLVYDNKKLLGILLKYDERIVWSSTEAGIVYKGYNDGPKGENTTGGWEFEGYGGHTVKLTSHSGKAHNGVQCIDFNTGEILTIAKTYGKTVMFIKAF